MLRRLTLACTAALTLAACDTQQANQEFIADTVKAVEKSDTTLTPDADTSITTISSIQPISSWSFHERTDPFTDERWWQVVGNSKSGSARIFVDCSDDAPAYGIEFDHLNLRDHDQITIQRIRWDSDDPDVMLFSIYDNVLRDQSMPIAILEAQLALQEDSYYYTAADSVRVRTQQFVDRLASGSRLRILIDQHRTGTEMHDWSLVGSSDALAMLPCYTPHSSQEPKK